MVLSSQRNRGGPGGLYSSGTRKRKPNRVWIGLGLAVVAMLIGYRWMVDDDAPEGNIQSADAATVADPDPRRLAESSTPQPGSTFTGTPSAQAMARADAAPMSFADLERPAPPRPTTPGIATEPDSKRTSTVTATSASTSAAKPTATTGTTPAPRPTPGASPDGPVPDTTGGTRIESAPRLGQVPVGLISASPTAPASEQLREGMALIERGQPVKGRAVLSRLLFGSGAQPRMSLSPRDAQSIRDVLASVNQSLVFSDRISPGDPLTETYTVQSGDMLVRIAPRYRISYHLIERINHVDARRLRVGQKLKLVKGPFHAVVHKSAFRMDLYLNDPDGQPIYVRSFSVGLGENDSTPIGRWRVRPNSKLENPGWTHPRTNVYFAPDNIENPIGEYWLGLDGLDENTKGRNGYGIHGTIEPNSVGRMMSLGCIRLLPDDIALIFELLVETHSTVEVRP